MKKSAPESEPESPIPLGPQSNGEVPPPPFTRRHQVARDLFRRIVDEKSRRLGISRRTFVDSACGTLAGMWVLDAVSGCSSGGSSGSGPTTDAGYNVPADALEDEARADAMLAGEPFIFDVQVHNTAPKPPWNASVCEKRDPMICPTDFMNEIFVASDTTVACLSGFPAVRGAEAPSMETREKMKQLLDIINGPPRLLMHANVRPILGSAELDAAEKDARTFPVAAWKTYPDGGRLDDPAQADFFRRARDVNVKIIASHRGLGGKVDYDDVYSPRDVVHAASMYKDFSFLVYHAGFDTNVGEHGPYNEATPSGVDRLFKAMAEFNVGKEGNVYAELGSTWNMASQDPVQAAHLMGKLLLHLGPDRILWGTDCVLTGRPQSQIDRFKVFQIPPSLQEMHGYPALTDETRQKILGLNAARVYGVDPAVVRRKITGDDLSKLKLARREDPASVPLSPHRPHGPRTWREYVGFRRWSGEPV